MIKANLLAAEDYTRVGDELDEIGRRLLRLEQILKQAYGLTWSDKVDRAASQIMALRGQLTSCFYQQRKPSTAKLVPLGDTGWDLLAGQIPGWRLDAPRQAPGPGRVETSDVALEMPQFLRRAPGSDSGVAQSLDHAVDLGSAARKD